MRKNVIIQVKDVSKKYRLGEINTGYLAKDLNAWWNKVLKKENPYLPIEREHVSANETELWALQNINFEVEKGEILGFVGKNGSGKSTLLKLLSRISAPSSGVIKVKGRIASLLEVGTGFHPDLTGKDNIYLNGAILGMKKAEITKKLDEIIAFAGIESFVNTPVKRYSSGMYVRLAFAVGAFLEPEILIVDEVLAVGDADFQKKCLGRMRDVSTNDGRTVLFVSHNMQAINSLCTKAIWLDKGKIRSSGTAKQVTNNYLKTYDINNLKQEWTLATAPGNELIRVLKIEIIPKNTNNETLLTVNTDFDVHVVFLNKTDAINLSVDLMLFASSGECIFDLFSGASKQNQGLMESTATIPGKFLNNGNYYFALFFGKDVTQELFYLDPALQFEIGDERSLDTGFNRWLGFIRPDFPIQMRSLTSITDAN